MAEKNVMSLKEELEVEQKARARGVLQEEAAEIKTKLAAEEVARVSLETKAEGLKHQLAAEVMARDNAREEAAEFEEQLEAEKRNKIAVQKEMDSIKEKWEAVGEAVAGNLVTENSGGKENERTARVVAQKALELELESKPTSLEQDEETWSKKDSLGLSSKDLIAL